MGGPVAIGIWPVVSRNCGGAGWRSGRAPVSGPEGREIESLICHCDLKISQRQCSPTGGKNKGRVVSVTVYGTWHLKDPLRLIGLIRVGCCPVSGFYLVSISSI